jgi:hypothetical protein
VNGVSRPIGDRLPDLARGWLSGTALETRVGSAVPIATTDSQGRPHPALLSYGEVIALDARRLRLALHRTSATLENIRRDGRLTLCLIEPGGIFYIKATARVDADPLPGFADRVRVTADVEAVLEDGAREEAEGAARLTSGVRYRPGRPVAVLVADWTRVVRALEAA